MINNERANLAALNAASIAHRPVIVAPGYSAGMGGRLPGGSMGLGGGMPRPQLGERMRSRSLSGVIPGAGYGGSPFLGGASPRTMPMGSPSQRPVVHNVRRFLASQASQTPNLTDLARRLTTSSPFSQSPLACTATLLVSAPSAIRLANSISASLPTSTRTASAPPTTLRAWGTSVSSTISKA